MDKMGSSTLVELFDELARSDVKILIANANEQFIETCKACNVFERIRRTQFFETVLDAAVYASRCTDSESVISSVV